MCCISVNMTDYLSLTQLWFLPAVRFGTIFVLETQRQHVWIASSPLPHFPEWFWSQVISPVSYFSLKLQQHHHSFIFIILSDAAQHETKRPDQEIFIATGFPIHKNIPTFMQYRWLKSAKEGPSCSPVLYYSLKKVRAFSFVTSRKQQI